MLSYDIKRSGLNRLMTNLYMSVVECVELNEFSNQDQIYLLGLAT